MKNLVDGGEYTGKYTKRLAGGCEWTAERDWRGEWGVMNTYASDVSLLLRVRLPLLK